MNARAGNQDTVDAALDYVAHMTGERRHTELFRSKHGHPSAGARRMGCSEFETLPHCAARVLAAEVLRLRAQAQPQADAWTITDKGREWTRGRKGAAP